MRVKDYLREKRAFGYYSFSIDEIERVVSRSRKALLAALERLARAGEIVSPFQGFYVIIAPEFHTMGSLPADQLIVLLMEYLKRNYYVGLLSAAQYYGAAHQQPLAFQVMLEKNRPMVACGKVKIIFIAKKSLKAMPTQLFKTPRGPLQVATPEVTAMDLVTYPHQCGGLNNVVTVLQELSEHISAHALIELAQASQESAWIQRLGYLFSCIGAHELAESLEKCLKNRSYYFKPLSTKDSIKGFPRNKRWQLIINTGIEPDL